MKKALSLFLTVLMAMSIITVAGTSVSAAETANVNGEACYVGSTVNFVYKIVAPGKAEDFQGQLEYTSGLKLIDAQWNENKGSVMVNTKIENFVYYSGTSYSDPYNMDTNGGLTATFEVVKGGDQKITNRMELITSADSKTQYFEDFKNNGCTEESTVTVNPVEATDVQLDTTSATLETGKQLTLNATVTPELAALTNEVVWSTSNDKVATVNKGVVTAVKAGTATITATVGPVKAECVVTVKQPVTSIKLSKTKATVYNGKTLTLKATVNPSDASNKSVTWKSSNTKIATVSSKGVVKGVKPGTAKVTVTAKDGSKKSATCTVTVKAQKATKLTISKKSATLAKKGKSVSVKATLSPSNTYNKQIKVTTSKKSVAKISASKINSGKSVKITAVKKGKANVKFTAADGSKKNATCKVTVKK